MSLDTLARPDTPADRFWHEAFLYQGMGEFLDGTSAFILDGIEAEEAVLVVVSAEKIARLRQTLGRAADEVEFADMNDVGGNPARIIPVWQAFVDDCAQRDLAFRGIGEPVFPERTAAELDECQRHEALLNVAFSGGRPWSLMCPYDAVRLSPDLLDHARCSHPQLWEGEGAPAPSTVFRGQVSPFAGVLPEPVAETSELAFGPNDLRAARALVSGQGDAAGLGIARTSDLVLAANEIATNSLRYGGGRGILRAWRDRRTLICEIRDGGQIREPLAGRVQPDTHTVGGRGLWLANQLCDLVQIRSSEAGTVVRLHMYLG